jgi:hypothetical protein
MYDLTRVGLDTLAAELDYRHTVDAVAPAGTHGMPALRRRVLRRRIPGHGRIRHADLA